MDIGIFYADSQMQVDDDFIRELIIGMNPTADEKFKSSAFQMIHALLLAGV